MMIKPYWKWYARDAHSSRLRRSNDETIHIRKNGDLYFVYSDQLVRRPKARPGQKKQA